MKLVANLKYSQLINPFEQLTKITDESSDLFCLLNEHLEMIYANPAVYKVLGYERLKRPWPPALVFNPQSEAEFKENLIAAIECRLTSVSSVISGHSPDEGKGVRIEFKAMLNYDADVFVYALLVGKTIDKPYGEIGLNFLNESNTGQINRIFDTDDFSLRTWHRAVRDTGDQRDAERKLQVTLQKLKKQNKTIYLSNKKLTDSQNALKEINKTLKLKTDALNQMAIVVVSDAKGNIIEGNKRFLQVSGYKKEEILNELHSINENSIFNSDTHTKEFFDRINQTLKSGKVWRGEICNRTKSGKPFWLLNTTVPILNNKKEIEQFFSFSNDITLLKKREAEILEAKKIAEDASKSKEDFLSVMSHEIRTPLNSVIGLSNLLQKKSPREDQVEIIRTLKNSSDYLLHLVNDILDYGKIQAAKVELEYLQLNLYDFLTQLNSLFKPLATEKGLDFNISVEPALPVFVTGDVTRLNQVLNNLISNAIKFTRKGFVNLSVKLKETRDKEVVVIFEVRDSGIGIAMDKLSSIYTPFHQTERDISRRFGGTGLGLSIVRELAELMRGKLKVSSTLGEGSTFVVELPFGLEDYPLNKSVDGKTASNVVTNMQGLNILYVEDVESNRFLIRTLLEDYGINCKCVSNGRQALGVTLKHQFDVILMDIQMPVMDGYKVTRGIQNQIKGKNKNTPVIAFTAEPFSTGLKKRIFDHRIKGVIHKPFKTETLLEKIQDVTWKAEKPAAVISLHFYEEAFDHDKNKVMKVIPMIRNDFQRLERMLLRKAKKKAMKDLYAEIHRLRPIINNLKCSSLSVLLDQYKLEDMATEQIQKLDQELKVILKNVYRYLDAYCV